MAISRYRSVGDIISISASVLCTVHCILLPLFLTTLPLFDIELLENLWLEIATVAVSAIAGGWAIWRGYRHFHHQLQWVAWFGIGFLLMVSGNFVPAEWMEMTLKAIGALFITIGHVGNLKQSKHQHCHTK